MLYRPHAESKELTVPWRPLNAGWFARPCSITGAPGIQHGEPPGAGKAGGGCIGIDTADMDEDGAWVGAVPNEGDTTTVDDSLDQVAGAKTVVEDSGVTTVCADAVAFESRTNVAGGKTAVHGSDGATVTGGKPAATVCG